MISDAVYCTVYDETLNEVVCYGKNEEKIRKTGGRGGEAVRRTIRGWRINLGPRIPGYNFADKPSGPKIQSGSPTAATYYLPIYNTPSQTGDIEAGPYV
jgi:hypothetical protein